MDDTRSHDYQVVYSLTLSVSFPLTSFCYFFIFCDIFLGLTNISLNLIDCPNVNKINNT